MATIIDTDKVLVMEKGELVQFDHPYKLLVLNEDDNDITNLKSKFA